MSTIAIRESQATYLKSQLEEIRAINDKLRQEEEDLLKQIGPLPSIEEIKLATEEPDPLLASLTASSPSAATAAASSSSSNNSTSPASPPAPMDSQSTAPASLLAMSAKLNLLMTRNLQLQQSLCASKCPGTIRSSDAQSASVGASLDASIAAMSSSLRQELPPPTKDDTMALSRSAKPPPLPSQTAEVVVPRDISELQNVVTLLCNTNMALDSFNHEVSNLLLKSKMQLQSVEKRSGAAASPVHSKCCSELRTVLQEVLDLRNRLGRDGGGLPAEIEALTPKAKPEHTDTDGALSFPGSRAPSEVPDILSEYRARRASNASGASYGKSSISSGRR